MAAASIFFTACENEQEAVVTQQETIDMSDFYAYTDEVSELSSRGEGGKACHSMHVLNRQLQENPGLYNKMYNIEKNARKFINAKKPDGTGGGKPGGGGGGGGGGTDPVDDGLGVINIPVYVHVIYNNSQENISDAQINSQIAVLNADFRKTNNDIGQAPSEYAGSSKASGVG